MKFGESVRRNMGPNYLFKFAGRASRSEFWWFMLFAMISITIATFFLYANPIIGSVIIVCTGLGLVPPITGLYVRRLHDLNLSGWWFLAYLIVDSLLAPLGFLAMVLSLGACVVLAWPGTPRMNRYGYPPQFDQAIPGPEETIFVETTENRPKE